MQWLQQQADAAGSVGAKVQYCMNLPSSVLASTRFQAVTQAREAKDHVRDPLGYSWKAGLSGSLLHAVGLGSSIDNIFTSSDQPGCTGGFNCTEPNPDYEMILASLSGGPVALGDGLSFTARPIALQACMEDGTLLRPDKQLTMSDAALRLSFDPVSELDIWSAFSVVSGWRASYILSTFLPNNVSISALDLDLDGQHVAWDRSVTAAAYSNYRPISYERDLTIPSCPRPLNPRFKNWVYTLVVPLLCSGCPVFLGEVSKVVSVSSVRFGYLAATTTHVSVVGVGVAGEVLRLGISAPTGLRAGEVQVREVAVRVDGTFSAKLKLD